MVTSRATANSYDVLPCDRVITIPQYIGTCWFNALLMTVFYSEAMRDVVQFASERSWEPFRQSNNAYLRRVIGYFDHMLRLYKRPTDHGAYKFYDKITPERILYFLHKSAPKYLEYDAIARINGKYVLREGTTAGYHTYRYAHKLLKFLRIPNISLTGIPVNKQNEYGPFRLTIGNAHSKTLVDFKKAKNHAKDAYSFKVQPPKYVESLLRSKPHVLVVNIGQKDTWKSHSKEKRPEYYFLPNVYTNLPEFIRLHGHTYILDSCAFGNNNQGAPLPPGSKKPKVGGHAIAGVTCNRRRFIYSGWVKKTKNSARGSNVENDDTGGLASRDRPCSLMPFEWTKDKRNFYIASPSKSCQLQFRPPKPESVRFNSLHGPRLYLYVRQDMVHYKKHALQRLKSAYQSGDKAHAVRLGFSVAKQTLADALRRKASIDRANGSSKPSRKPITDKRHLVMRKHVRQLAKKTRRR